ncbi:MAG: DUF4340 domain-containing protein [Alphaproteobacteria bacterium]|nr:DUF4340 domain-containing protein [Alphaproteobacteria bacterium]
MQPRHFNLLALTAIISLIAAGVVHSAYNNFSDDEVTGDRLFPSLEDRAAKTGQIAIRKGEGQLTFKRSEDGKVWSIVERSGYPIDATKVRKLVLQLAEAELIERKTRNEKLYGQLGLGDPTEKDAKSKLVKIADAGGGTIAEVVVGNERHAAFGTGKSGTYVRVPGNDQTWLAKLDIDASTDVADWVDPVFFKADKDKFASLVVKQGDGVVYKLVPAEKKDGGFELADVPAGKKVKESVRIDDLVNGIRTLEMTDVRKAQEADAKPDMTAEITMQDGAKYLVGMKEEDRKRWITVDVLDNGKDADAAKKFADATKGWAFEIADWRAKQTFKPADELFETVKVEAPATSVTPQEQPIPRLGPRLSPQGKPPAVGPKVQEKN